MRRTLLGTNPTSFFTVQPVPRILVLACILIGAIFTGAAFADPNGTIVGEDAFLQPPRKLIIQDDVILSRGYIDEWELRTRLRYGLIDRVELMCAYSLSYFPDLYSQDDLYSAYYEGLFTEDDPFHLYNPRISYIEPSIKANLLSFGPNLELLAYGKYRHNFGIPLLVDYPTTGNDDDAVAVTTRNASAGDEITLGAITSFLLSDVSEHAVPTLIVGAELRALLGKDWTGADSESVESEGLESETVGQLPEMGLIAAAYVTPQLKFLKKWKIQLESRFEWWIGRGIHLELVPGIRWEPFPYTVVEGGIGFPIVGGDVSRFFIGFSFSFGRTKIVLRVYDIHFPPDSPNLWGFSDSEQIESNRAALSKLAAQIEGYPDYDILIEGHTSSVHWDDADEFAREQREEMLPLSEARAAAVRQALIDLGIEAERLSSVGKGGSEPIVDFSKRDEQWKNRRVEIELTERAIVD